MKKPRSSLSSIALRIGAIAAAVLAVVRPAGAGEPPRDDAPRKPRIVAVDIDLRIDPGTSSLSQSTKLLLEGSGVSHLSLDLNEGLSIETARASEGTVEARKLGRTVQLELSPALEGRRTVTLTLSGRPTSAGRSGDPIDGARVLLDGRDAWYPSLPGTWARAAVSVHVPEGWTAMGPGRLDERRGGGAWRWVVESPVRSVAVVAAPGLRLTEAPLAETTLRVASAPGGVEASRIVATFREPMIWFSGALAPYAFDGFNLALLPGDPPRVRGSGILAVADRRLPDGPADAAGLLSEQWLGERVAADGRWIDAFAAWEAVVFARDRGHPAPSEIGRLREEYFDLPPSMDVPIARADATTPEAVLRGKGSAVPDMIRLSASDRDFFGTIRELFGDPEAPPLTLAGLRSALERRSERTLLRAFSDWLERTGSPRFEASLRTRPASGGGWRVDVEIRQRGPLYALPIEVLLVGPNDRVRDRIEIDDERTTVFRVLDFEPARLDLDPSRILFRDVRAGGSTR